MKWARVSGVILLAALGIAALAVAGVLFGWDKVVVAVGAAGALAWLLRAAWRSSFPSPDDELSPEARRAMSDKLAEIAKRRAYE